MTASTQFPDTASLSPGADMLDLDILHAHAAWDDIPGTDEFVRRAVIAAIAPPLSGQAVEVCVLLQNDDAMRALNKQWRDKDKPTNVLSFPAPEAPGPAAVHHLGDIALGFETLMAEAAAEKKTVEHHLQHLVVHGMLHLQGMDHETAEEADEMEALETRILAGLGVPDPYAA